MIWTGLALLSVGIMAWWLIDGSWRAPQTIAEMKKKAWRDAAR